MLTRLRISDFALIDQLDLDLLPGFSVLTGETGAGKSIIIDAIGLALGDRADTSAVRPGAERADISAEFVLPQQHPLIDWLAERDLGDDAFVVLRRVVGTEGRTRAYINGQPVTVQVLKEVGEQLLDVHGQHAHYSLLRAEIQRELLDRFGSHDQLTSAVAAAYADWRHARDDVDRLNRSAAERGARVDALQFQVQELDALELKDGEVPALEDEQRRLAHAEELIRATQDALTGLEGDSDHSLLDSATRIHHTISDCLRLDERLTPIAQMLDDALIQLREAASALRHYSDGEGLDPDRLRWVDERLGAVYHLARKHRIAETELCGLHERLRHELDELVHADEHLEKAEQQLASTERVYREAAKRLSAQRKKTAAKLAQAVDTLLQKLGMPHGKFVIELSPVPKQTPQASGDESVHFAVSTNPGHAPAPLEKVASGGELARISLAIAVASAAVSCIPTLIFDEVDTGVGGGIAETIGQLMRGLGITHQVFCVTHAPQIAALGHQHLKVSKSVHKGLTHTELTQLSDVARQEELARMLGGVEITKQTRAHAKEMLAKGKSKKSGDDSLLI